MCIGIYQLIRGRSFGKTFLSLFGIGLLSLIPLGIWFYAAWLQGGQPFMDLMLEENTGRFVGKMSYPSHHNPLWYNFLTIIWGWTPWTLVLLISLFGLKWNESTCCPQETLSPDASGRFGITSAHIPHTAVYLDSDYRYFCLLLYS